jgi:hypothetical protein
MMAPQLGEGDLAAAEPADVGDVVDMSESSSLTYRSALEYVENRGYADAAVGEMVRLLAVHRSAEEASLFAGLVASRWLNGEGDDGPHV